MEKALVIGRSYWKTIEQGMEREWLVTNGIGGFASSTICGANSRRYHGLLIASLRPPAERHLVLAKMDESITVAGTTTNIYSFRTPDALMEGFRHQESFRPRPVPEFNYRVGDVFIKKKICMVYGENTTVITYEVVNGGNTAVLRITPLVNFRNYHHCSRRHSMVFDSRVCSGTVCIRPFRLPVNITLECDRGEFVKADDMWFMNMEYTVERCRGLDCLEDHYIPGYFDIKIKPGQTERIAVKASVEKQPDKRKGFTLVNEQEKRADRLMLDAPFNDHFGMRLSASADAFIVRRKSTDKNTIIAGYPWFTDWGRDTMISLPGLTLTTGRYDEAREILHTFCSYLHKGLIPNVFPDEGQQPAYNSVDASLWFFEAAAEYIKRTDDRNFLKDVLYPAMKGIFVGYRQGTMFDIRMDDDCLITAGNEGTQLTWMDAAVNGRVITPRHGKAVEVNALWYNAVCVLADMAEKLGKDASEYARLADSVRTSFAVTFINRNKGCLYDVVLGKERDASIRPNQILAASLSHPVADMETARGIVKVVQEKLYTPYGLRSLSPDSVMYRGIYGGSQEQRDEAYHQGTVWAWLAAPFIKAYLRVNRHSSQSIEKAREMLYSFYDHLNDACMDSVSEIFDGDYPHYPRGCFAQAWSVAGILEIHGMIEQAR